MEFIHSYLEIHFDHWEKMAELITIHLNWNIYSCYVACCNYADLSSFVLIAGLTIAQLILFSHWDWRIYVFDSQPQTPSTALVQTEAGQTVLAWIGMTDNAILFLGVCLTHSLPQNYFPFSLWHIFCLVVWLVCPVLASKVYFYFVVCLFGHAPCADKNTSAKALKRGKQSYHGAGIFAERCRVRTIGNWQYWKK